MSGRLDACRVTGFTDSELGSNGVLELPARDLTKRAVDEFLALRLRPYPAPAPTEGRLV
jgi:hypothetical protein